MHPHTLWAQRADTVFVTIALENIKEPTLKVDDARFFFKCGVIGGQDQFELDFKFFKEVDCSVSIRAGPNFMESVYVSEESALTVAENSKLS